MNIMGRKNIYWDRMDAVIVSMRKRCQISYRLCIAYWQIHDQIRILADGLLLTFGQVFTFKYTPMNTFTHLYIEQSITTILICARKQLILLIPILYLLNFWILVGKWVDCDFAKFKIHYISHPLYGIVQ